MTVFILIDWVKFRKKLEGRFSKPVEGELIALIQDCWACNPINIIKESEVK